MTTRLARHGNEQTVPPHVTFARLVRAEIEIQRRRVDQGKAIEWDRIDELFDKMAYYMPTPKRST